MKNIFTMMCIACLFGCSGAKYMTATGYMGIPHQKRYPGKAEPISAARDKYYAISKVEDVPYKDYLWYKSRDRAKFIAQRGNTIYFSAEMNADFETEPGVREYVTILERKRTTVPEGTEQRN